MTPDVDETPGALRGAVMRGSAWMVAMRWAMRGIGLVNTMILVRLLQPEDFGLVSMGMLVISLLDSLTGLGVEAAMIQRRDTTREHLDTAWTLRALQTGTVAMAVFAAAPMAAAFFDEPRIVPLLRFLSATIFVAGLENIGVVEFRKDLDFATEFRLRVIPKFLGVACTILLALWLRSYWALAWGILINRAIAIAASYVMHPYRPRASLAKLRDLWSFSQWMLLRNIGMYARRQVDAFVVGRFFSTAQMGLYSVPKEIAEMPTTEVVWPAARVLFPGFAKLTHDPKRLARAFENVLSAIALFVIPATIGLALLADPAVRVILGEKWVDSIPILRWLALYNAFLTLSATVQNPMMALGRMRRLAALVWIQSVVAVPVILLAARQGDVVLIAQTQAWVALALCPVFFGALLSVTSIRARGLLAVLWRPVAASGVMAAALAAVGIAWSSAPVAVLLGNAALGALVFVGVDLALWRAAGRPAHAEQVVLDLVAPRVRKWLRRRR